MKHFRKFNVKFILKQILSLSMTMFILIGMTSFWSFASDDEPVSKYEETHDQINFDNLMVTVVDKENLVVEVDPTASFFDKIDAKRQKSKYEKFIKDNPDDVDELLDTVSDGGYLCAMSYTEAPLEYKDGHYERILKKPSSTSDLFTASAADTTTSAYGISDWTKGQGKFSLRTSISRYEHNSKGVYTYRSRTYGKWENAWSNIFNGSQYPAAVRDTVTQACPIIISNDVFACTYSEAINGSTAGQEGTHYTREAGNNSWVRYSIVDDPVGKAQLSTFRLTQKFFAKSTSDVKRINSAYCHTWKKVDLQFKITGSAEISGGAPTFGVFIEITPNIVADAWTVYNYVSYKF